MKSRSSFCDLKLLITSGVNDFHTETKLGLFNVLHSALICSVK